MWAHTQLDALWAGKVAAVLAELEPHRAAGEGVTAALSYYTTHRHRMDYAAYRARGLQIGSGSVESACKQLVSARLKQAGMIWEAAGAEAVATVRAWLKRERWQEAMALRPPVGRRYRRQHPRTEPAGGASTCSANRADEPPAGKPPVTMAHSGGLPPEVLARVRADLRPEPEQHPWRKPWSLKRQQEQQAGQTEGARTALAA